MTFDWQNQSLSSEAESQKFPLDWKSFSLRTSPNSNVRMFLKVISSFVRWSGATGSQPSLPIFQQAARVQRQQQQLLLLAHRRQTVLGWKELGDQVSGSPLSQHQTVDSRKADRLQLYTDLSSWQFNKRQADDVTWLSHVWRHTVWARATGNKSYCPHGQDIKWTKLCLKVTVCSSGTVSYNGNLNTETRWEASEGMTTLGAKPRVDWEKFWCEHSVDTRFIISHVTRFKTLCVSARTNIGAD